MTDRRGLDRIKQQQDEEIKKYKMIEGEYKISIRVYEANDLIPKKVSFLGIAGSETIDPIVLVNCGGNKKYSKVKKKDLNPVFNQPFDFRFQKLTKQQLEDMTICFTILDKRSFIMSDAIIGAYEIDLTSVYFSYQHEIYMAWLTLTDPTDEVEGAMGYLKVTISILGPNDELPVHDVNQAKKPGAIKEQALTPAKVRQIGHQIDLEIYRAEHLVPLDLQSLDIDAYVEARYSGINTRSRVIKSNHPEWNEKLLLACMLPNQSKLINVLVYDRDRLFNDELVGTFKIRFTDIREKDNQPKWANIYGSPLLAKGEQADIMNIYGDSLGSHYRGRLLYKGTSYYNKEPKSLAKKLKFEFPKNPYPSVPQKAYILRVDILEGHELPSTEDNLAMIQVSMGPYLMTTEQPKLVKNGRVKWYESFQDKKVLFPQDIEQVPDIIFYLADDVIQSRRFCYYRLKAKDVLCTDQESYNENKKPRILCLKEDRSLNLVPDDQFPGFLFVRVMLLSMYSSEEERKSRKERKIIEPSLVKPIKYQLRVFLYVARNLPPGDSTGTSDPFIKMRCAGKTAFSSVKYGTLNPGWYETIKMNIEIPPLDGTALVPAGMCLMLYDSQSAPHKKKQVQPQQASAAENLQTDLQLIQQHQKMNFSKIKNPNIEGNEDEPQQQEENFENIETDYSEDMISPLNEPFIVDKEDLELEDNQLPKRYRRRDLLGRCWIPLNPLIRKFKLPSGGKIDILFRKPKWYNVVYDPTDEVCGSVMLAYSLIEQTYADQVPEDPIIYPRYEKKKMHIFCIGLRDIDLDIGEIKPKVCSMTYQVSGGENGDHDPVKTDKIKIKNSGINVNKLISLDIDVPHNRHFCPILDICAWEESPERRGKKALLGYGCLNLYDILKKNFKIKEQDIELQKIMEEEDDEEEFLEALKQKEPEELVEVDAPLNLLLKDFDIDQMEIKIPQELPRKNKVLDDDEFNKQKVELDEKKRKKDLLKSSYQQQILQQSQMLLQFQDDHQKIIDALKRETTYNDGLVDQNFGMGEMNSQVKQNFFNDEMYQPNLYVSQNQMYQVNGDMVPIPEEDGQELNQSFNRYMQRNIQEEQKAPPNQEIQFQFLQSEYQVQQQQQTFPQKKDLEMTEGGGQINEQQYKPINVKAMPSDNNAQVPDLQSQQQPQINQENIQQGYIQNTSHQDEQHPSQFVDNNDLSHNTQHTPIQIQQQPQPQDQLNYNPNININMYNNQMPVDQQISQHDNSQQQQQQQPQISILQQNPQPIISNIFLKQQQQQDIIQQQNDLNISMGNEGINNPQINILDNQRDIIQPPPLQNNQINQGQGNLLSINQHKKSGSNQNLNIKQTKDQTAKPDKPEDIIIQQTPVGQTAGKDNKRPLEVLSTTTLSNFQVKTKWSVSQPTKLSSKALTIGQIPKDNLDVVDPEAAIQKKVIKKETKSFFQKLKKPKIRETYEDFDTDEDEDLDITPAWLKNRDLYNDDLEDKIPPNKKLFKIPLKNGQTRGYKKSITNILEKMSLVNKSTEPQITCYMKCLFLEEKPGQNLGEKMKLYESLMKPKPYICRIYITRGLFIGGQEPNKDLFIKVRMAEVERDLKHLTFRKQTCNPDFYIVEDIACEIPGNAFLYINVYNDVAGNPELVGFTDVDLEDRFFTRKWNKLNCNKDKQVPIEQRNLKPEFGSGSQGRLEMWIEIIPKKDIFQYPPAKIEPPPRIDCEIRTIVWSTDDCVFKDEIAKCNDLYCRGGLSNGEMMDTDIHWRCRAKGSFNWRWKFTQKYPLTIEDYGADRFKVQLWDYDVVGASDLIGETFIDLNTHKLIDKVLKRRKPVQLRQRILGPTSNITEKVWYDVYHPKEIDENGKPVSQGRVQLSFQILPMEEAKKKENGFGRNSPNIEPYLDEPTGRLKFDVMNPAAFIKDMIGPDLYAKCWKTFCCLLCTGICVAVGWILVTNIIGVKIAI